MYCHLHLNVSLVDLELKGAEEALDSQAIAESEATHHSSASSHGRRIRWLLSSASLRNIEEEAVSVEPRLESSASGATLEVSICIHVFSISIFLSSCVHNVVSICLQKIPTLDCWNIGTGIIKF